MFIQRKNPTMPKEEKSVSSALDQYYVKECSDFITDGSVLFCQFCEVSVTAAKTILQILFLEFYEVKNRTNHIY